MSRYDDPEGIGGFPGAGKKSRGSAGKRRSSQGGGKRPGRRSGKPRGGKPPKRLSRLSPFLGTNPILGIAAIISTVVVVGVSLVAYAAVRNVYDGINQETITSQMLGKRPPKLNGSTNILMIGSDSRSHMHGKYGKGILGSRSDTAMLLHISPDHSHAYVISFPRDSMVPIYGCLPDHEGHPGQSAVPGQLERLNATFSDGGAPCLWKTLEQTTHIHIDHFLEVDFNSFKSIVNDLGGISVCLPFAINNPQANLHLSAGRHLVHGAQALAFVRLRENIGDGSDLQRIQRQQVFLASAMQKVSHANLLSDYKVIRDAAHALTTDLSLTDMLGIANSMKGLNPKALRFISVPVVPYPGDPLAEVQWESPQSDQLFSAIAHDTHILKVAKAGKAKKATPAPTVSPSQVQLEVLNGSGANGVAATTATNLADHGFNVIGTGDAANFNFTSTVIEYSSASQLPEVNTLKKDVPGVQVKQASGLQPGTISLVLGSQFNGLTGSGAKKKGPSVASLSKNYQGISGNQNICKDTSAFTGPLSPVPAGG